MTEKLQKNLDNRDAETNKLSPSPSLNKPQTSVHRARSLTIQLQQNLNDLYNDTVRLSPSPGLQTHWMSAHQQRIFMSLVCFATGFSAITALATAIVGWLPLDIAAYVLVWPSLVL